MNLTDVMAQLEQMGTETNRRIYRNHGAQGAIFGVSTANLKTLIKTIKRDHALAEQLWATDNYDAQALAAQIADPSRMTEDAIERWAQRLNSHSQTDYFADLVAQTPFANAKAQQWKDSPNEWLARAGWHLIAKTAAAPQHDDAELAAYLPLIEQDIHTRPNRTRQAMLNALIAIGGRSPSMMETASETARRIGPVEIDHGDTNCETPDPIAYMKKMLERAQKKAAKTAQPT